MHIFCFCHKLALIVNAGLAELGVKAPPPIKVKSTSRGSFPAIGSIQEEEEEDLLEETTGPSDGSARQTVIDDDVSDHEHDPQDLEGNITPPFELDDEGEWDTANAEDNICPQLALEKEVAPTHRREVNHIDFILNKVRSQKNIIILIVFHVYC